jgi:hypothetical protein
MSLLELHDIVFQLLNYKFDLTKFAGDTENISPLPIGINVPGVLRWPFDLHSSALPSSSV